MYARPEIKAMQGYLPGEQPPPGKMIKLNTNENPYAPSVRVIEAIRATLDQGLQRYPDPLATAFRLRAATLLGVDPDWILCGNGSDELLTIAIRTFVGAGQAIRAAAPSYLLYATLAAIQGADCQQLPFRPNWTLPEGFEQCDPRVRLVVLANPNSPSGTLLSTEDLLKVARSLSCPLLIDEAYVDFADRHCLSLVREADNVMVTRSLSKSYALAGLRFGYVVAPPELIAEMAKVKDSYNCSALAIAGATAAIDDQDWLRETRQKILATRERLTARLRSIGFDVTPSQANFVWCTRRDRPILPLFQALRQQHVLVRYMNYDGWGEGLRISIGTDDQTDACLAALSFAVGTD